MLHWLQLVSLASSSPPTTDHSLMSIVQREVAAQLRGGFADRSRTPKGGRGHAGPRRRKEKQEFANHRSSTAFSSWSSIFVVCTESDRQEEMQGEEDRSRQASASRFCMASQRPSERRRRGSHQNQGNGVCYAFQEAAASTVSCAHANTSPRMRRSTWIQPAPVFAEKVRSSHLYPSSTIY